MISKRRFRGASMVRRVLQPCGARKRRHMSRTDVPQYSCTFTAGFTSSQPLQNLSILQRRQTNPLIQEYNSHLASREKRPSNTSQSFSQSASTRQWPSSRSALSISSPTGLHRICITRRQSWTNLWPRRRWSSGRFWCVDNLAQLRPRRRW